MKGTEIAGMSKEKEEETYFLDTYAIFEFINGNLNYAPYKKAKIITTVFNLAELNYNLKKQMAESMADKYTEDYYKFTVEITLENINEAMDLKTKHRNLSIPDAIGYIIAKKHKVKFLTGDEDFKDFDNVELFKK